MGKHKKGIGYFLYGLLLTLGLLYYRFPSDAFRDYLQASAAKVDPGVVLSMDRVSPSYRLGLRFLGTQISHKKILKGALFKAERLVIRPGIWSLLRGKGELLFEGLAYSGLIKGSAEFEERSIKAPFKLSIQLKDMRIDDYENLRGLIGRHVKGGVSGVIAYSGRSGALMDGAGEAQLTLSNGRVELLQPILNLQAVDFREVGVKMVLKNQRIELTQAELKGPNMQGTLSGVVILNKEFSKSSLDLKGTMEPLGDFYKSLAGNLGETKFFKQRLKGGKISFIIQGALAQPQIRFI
ncbi:MAG: type II secretion system protein GspN [Desulfobacterales bacterium]|nr:type II secretion system protein GspN [Desulfobacterales bacterium]